MVEDSILAERRAYLPSSLVTPVENILRGIEDNVGINIRAESVRDFLQKFLPLLDGVSSGAGRTTTTFFPGTLTA